MFGADLYETDDERARLVWEGKVPGGIGENSVIRLEILIEMFKSKLYLLINLNEKDTNK